MACSPMCSLSVSLGQRLGEVAPPNGSAAGCSVLDWGTLRFRSCRRLTLLQLSVVDVGWRGHAKPCAWKITCPPDGSFINLETSADGQHIRSPHPRVFAAPSVVWMNSMRAKQTEARGMSVSNLRGKGVINCTRRFCDSTRLISVRLHQHSSIPPMFLDPALSPRQGLRNGSLCSSSLHSSPGLRYLSREKAS